MSINGQPTEVSELIPHIYPTDTYDFSAPVRDLILIADMVESEGRNLRRYLSDVPEHYLEDMAVLGPDPEDEDEDLRETVAKLVERFIQHRSSQAEYASRLSVFGHNELLPAQAAFFAMANNGVDPDLAASIARFVAAQVHQSIASTTAEMERVQMSPALIEASRPGVAINPMVWRDVLVESV